MQKENQPKKEIKTDKTKNLAVNKELTEKIITEIINQCKFLILFKKIALILNYIGNAIFSLSFIYQFT